MKQIKNSQYNFFVSEVETQPVTFLKRKKLFICPLLLNTGNNNDLNETYQV